MKRSLCTTLLALATITLMVMTVGASGVRGLESIDVEKINAGVPSVKISGVAQLLQAINSASDFTNAAFDVITLDSFSQKITEQGVVYEGKLTIVNDQGVNFIGLINGAWDQVNNKLVLTASKYEVETEETEAEVSDDEGENPTTSPDDGYTQIEIEAAKNDPQVSAAFDWAVEELIETGERQNKIPISQYNVTAWTKAAYKLTPKGVNYKFVAELLGANYVHVETSMTVFYRSANQTYKLAGYYYRATNITKGSLPNNFTEVDNNNNTNSTNNTDVTPTPTIPIVPVGYTYISPEDLANNIQAQAALQSGVKALIEKGISQYKIPAASPDYNITNLISAAYKVQNFGATYLFNVNLTNALNYKVDTNLTVSYRASNQTFKLVAYKFFSYNYPKNAIVIPPKNNTNTTVPNNSTVVPPVNDTQPVDNTTVVVPPVDQPEPVDNSTVVVPPVEEPQPVDNSTVVVPPVEEPQPVDNSTVVVPPVEQPEPVDNSTVVVPPVEEPKPVDNSTVVPPVSEPVANNTVPPTTNPAPVNQTTSDGFIVISAEEFAKDSQAQAALQTGLKALIEKAVSQNKIPAKNPDYKVTNLISAASKKSATGTTYKFQVNTANVDNVKVDANLNVFYRYLTKSLSLNGYSFKSYNFSNKDLAKNNSTVVVAPVVANSTVVGANAAL